MEKSKSSIVNELEDLMNINMNKRKIKNPKEKNDEEEYNGFTIIKTNNTTNTSINDINEVVRSSVTVLPKNKFSLLSSIKSFTSTIYYNHLVSNPKLDFTQIYEPFIIFN